MLTAAGDEVICPRGRRANLVAAALARLRERGLGRPASPGRDRRSGSRSRPGWAAARPMPRRCCGWPGVSPRSGDRTRSPPSSARTSRASFRPGCGSGPAPGESSSRARRCRPRARDRSAPCTRSRPPTCTRRRTGSGSLVRARSSARGRVSSTPCWAPGRATGALLSTTSQPAALSLCPAIAARSRRARPGADRALVCGSGPDRRGLFWGRMAVREAAPSRR